MSELENCKGCGKLFVRVSSPYCPSCLKEQEKLFDMVYTYIRKQENRMSTVTQVHEATGVDLDWIYQWIREGRLKTAVFPNLGYPCRSCGRTIQNGTLCEHCRKNLEHDMQQEQTADSQTAAKGKTYHTEVK
ncbi:hypothetical protein NIE88_04270 [Sporolactobacillus shoreicorticis]|uniref:TIGR03826 family flagellar region protein n=1 Tax=Sporolactobacillus shoreicorticis TaxID=1923877 RepID=A0ABW5RZL8_9BACL|nr:TIGR03826 family flagellar region protein [Sporolactobacillus shoreicorticis]MCO7124990.1 hypothetical protein [Sporolactobacillus shoreicorticis]